MLRPPPYLAVRLGPRETSHVTVFSTATIRWEAAAVGTRLSAPLLGAALHLAGSDRNNLNTNHRPSQGSFIAPETEPGAFANHRPERHSEAGTARPWPEAALASPVRRRRSRRRGERLYSLLNGSRTQRRKRRMMMMMMMMFQVRPITRGKVCLGAGEITGPIVRCGSQEREGGFVL